MIPIKYATHSSLNYVKTRALNFDQHPKMYNNILRHTSLVLKTPSPRETEYATPSSWLAKSTSGINMYLDDVLEM